LWARPGHGTNSSAGPSSAWFVAADGSGNVAGLVSAADGTWEARYEYGPFGEPLRATGPMAAVNPFRFSSRWHDDETALVYYGHRYYSPELGRWLSQDPAGEAMGGRNLHTFVGNDPVGRHDILGLKGGSSGGGQVDRGTARRLKREGCCHVFTMKVDATGFDWRSAQTMIRSVARHLEEPVGHSWVRLEGEGYVAEGGHSGETGQLGRNPRITRQDFLTYGRGVVTLAGMDVTAAGPMPGVLEADPANPIRWLRYVYEDGHWAEGSGGHTRVTSECSWCVGPGEFAAAREAVEALRSGDGSALKAYGLTGQQCTSTAAGIAAVAGIHLDPYVHLTFPPFVDLRGVTVRLWTDPQFAAVSFALPDKLAFEMKKASGGPRKICR
jgi:RHS repeat-associated protein